MGLAARHVPLLFACSLCVAPGVVTAEPLRLAATLVTPDDAAALVEEAGGGQAWLRPGERLAGCLLLSVGRNAAAFDCDGRRSRLLLDAGAGAPGGHAQATPLVSAALPPGTLQALAARPQALALAVDFTPMVEHGQVLGWRVARLDAAGPLAASGLREADVVRRVNGAPASEPAAFAAAIRALPEAHAFTLELARDGSPLTLLVAAPPAAHR